MTVQLVPPFTLETALQKVQRAEDLWNIKDPQAVALAYTEDSQWRNRDQFVTGRAQIIELLTAKWQKEQDYRLKKELFTFAGDRIAVHFEYEYHDAAGQWYRAYGNEHWIFAQDGLMRSRDASINEHAIDVSERRIF